MRNFFSYFSKMIFKTALTIFLVHNAATDPKRILCCFRAVVLLLLAACVFLVVYCKAFLVFLVGSLVFFW